MTPDDRMFLQGMVDDLVADLRMVADRNDGIDRTFYTLVADHLATLKV